MHKEQDNILKNIKEHRYTGIDQLSTVTYLIEVINTMGLDSVKTFIMSDESLRQYFDGCMTLYKDFFKQSSVNDRQSLGIVESSTKDASGIKSVAFSPKDHYYDSNAWYTLSKSDKDKAVKARSGINVLRKASKSGGHYNSWGGRNNGQGKCKSNILMLEKKVRNQKRLMLVFNTAANPGLDDDDSYDSDKEDGNRKHYDLACQLNYKRSNKA